MRRLVVLPVVFLLTGCGYADSRMAHQAQINMQGMTAADLQSCAGVPDKSKKIDDHTEVFTYNLKNDSTGGVTVTLPIVGGGYTIGGSGSGCNANFRLVDNRVAGVFYSGNDDRPVGQDGVCTPIIRGCMRRPQQSMVPLTDTTRAQSSAYHQPPAVPVPVTAAPAAATGQVERMPTVGR